MVRRQALRARLVNFLSAIQSESIEIHPEMFVLTHGTFGAQFFLGFLSTLATTWAVWAKKGFSAAAPMAAQMRRDLDGRGKSEGGSTPSASAPQPGVGERPAQPEQVTEEVFEEARRRDSEGKRPRVMLVDAHEGQLIHAEIERSGALMDPGVRTSRSML